MEYFLLIIAGFIGGLIAGLLGLGGGIFYILVLPYVLRWYGIPEEQLSAFIISNSLFGIAFASAISIFSEYKHLKQYWKESLYMGVPAVIISIISTEFIVQSSWYSVKYLNIFIIALMVYILIQFRFKEKSQSLNARINPFSASSGGGLAGFISAISGLGGGIIIIPMLQLGFKQEVRKSKLISLVVIFLTSVFMSIQNLVSIPLDLSLPHVGYILPVIVIPLIAGVLIGSPMGVKLSYKLHDKQINWIFSGFVFLVLIEKLLYFL